MHRLALVLTITALGVSASNAPAGKGGDTLTLIDQAGKEVTLSNWKLSSGTRHLEWLDPAPGKEKPKKGEPARGPEALEMRALMPVIFEPDVTTFIPLTAVKQIGFDHAKKAVEVSVLGADGKDMTLSGTTIYKDINHFNLEGDVGPASLTVDKPFKLQDGYAKASIQAVRFPSAKPVAAVTGAKAVVVVRGKDKTKHEVFDLAPLYSTPSGLRLIPVLNFQKTLKIDVADIVRMSHLVPKDKKGGFLDFEVEKKDGMKLGLTLLDKGVQIEEKLFVNFLGFVGRVPAGYRLFPASRIEDVMWMSEKK